MNRRKEVILLLAYAAAVPPVLLCLSTSVFAGGPKYRSNFIKPPTTLDAGNDLDGDGANDTVAYPGCSGVRDHMVSFCVGGTSSSVRSSLCFSDADCSEGVCMPLRAPDGVTPADQPTMTATHGGIIPRRSRCEVKDTTLECKVAFNNQFSTDPTGHCKRPERTGGGACIDGVCVTGPDRDSACTTAEDCRCNRASDCPGAYCKSDPEDEYVCQVNILTGGNADNIPPCDPNGCISYDSFQEGDDDYIGAYGTCIGGTRDGLECRNTRLSDCPEGTCSCPLLPKVSATGDEWLIGSGDRKAFPTCRVLRRFDLPFDVSNGKGKVKFDLSGPFTIPPATPIQVLGCTIHEPGTHPVSWTGQYTTPNDPTDDVSYGTTACPESWIWFGSVGGSLTAPATAHGPIIGVTGVLTR